MVSCRCQASTAAYRAASGRKTSRPRWNDSTTTGSRRPVRSERGPSTPIGEPVSSRGAANRCRRRRRRVASSSRPSRASSSSERGPTRLGGLGGLLGLVLLLAGDPVLHRRGVHVDVLLAGQLHQRVHDLVGDRAQDEPVALHALVAREVERGADPHADPDQLGDLGAGRLRLVGVDHRDRDDGHPGLERHPGHAGLALVEPAVGAAGALGVQAEQLAAAEHLQARAQGGLAGPAAGAVDGQLADALEERRGQPALDALTGEVVALGEERHPAGHDERQEDRVGEREVVAREDRGPGLGDVLGAVDPRAEEQAEDRPQDDRLQHPVDHRTTLRRATPRL